jgi:hypothetical protein
MIPWGWIALLAFWGAAIWLWMVDGPRIPLIFIAIWAAGFWGFPCVGIPGFLFVPFEALLAAILLMVGRYKEAT